MLTHTQEKLIRSLHTKKGRRETGLCLVEGKKPIETAGEAVTFTVTKQETLLFDKLATTETPQEIIGVAHIPEWTLDDITSRNTIIVLDGVQDPGNTGAILRLCLGFDASLIFIESADPTSPKVIRSSVGAMFRVPWTRVSRAQADAYLMRIDRPVFRLERRQSSSDLSSFTRTEKSILIAGSEGSGIALETKGSSIAISHDAALESLNVGHAVAIALHAKFSA